MRRSANRRWLRTFRERLLYVAPFGAAAVILLFGALLLDLERRYARSVAESSRQYAAAEALNRTYFHLKDVEANQRGYLLTGDPSFLTEHQSASQHAESELDTLARVVLADGEQRAVAVLDGLARRRLAASRQVLRESSLRGREAAAATIADGEGRRAMNDFEAAVTALTSRVAASQAERERALERRFRELIWFIIAGTGAAAFTGIVSGVALARHGRQRALAAERLAATNEQLRAQTATLEWQKEELENQATELEGQTLELELQTRELEETTRELVEREERFRALVGHAVDMIFVLDVAGSITYASPAAGRVLGKDPPSLTGEAVTGLLHPDDREAVGRVLGGVIADGGAAVAFEARYAAADGGWRVLAGHVRNLLEQKGVRGIVINCRDITHERGVEAQLRQAQKMEAVGLLAGGVAHDFNNLLTSIHGYANFAADALDRSHPAHADLQEVLKAADLASSLTRQLLSFSRQQVTQPEILDLNAVLDDSAGLLRRLLGSSIEFATRFEPTLHPVLVDAGQIRQVIMNLAVNARDAMPDGGRLVIETGNVEIDEEHAQRRGVTAGRYAMISVNDNGEGIPPEIQERIFEPFFTTKEQGRGTGLGLSTIYGIARQAGGYVWLYSEIGAGTTFKIYLPAAVDRAAPARSLHAAVGPELGAGAMVLVVEDDAAVRAFACRALKRAGFTVLAACDGEEALQVLERTPSVRLVVTDVIMPGMSGAALGRQLDERYPAMRVLYTSGYPREEMSWRGSIPPNVAFIEKPYSSTDLARRIAELLAGGSGADGLAADGPVRTIAPVPPEPRSGS